MAQAAACTASMYSNCYSHEECQSSSHYLSTADPTGLGIPSWRGLDICKARCHSCAATPMMIDDLGTSAGVSRPSVIHADVARSLRG